MVEGNCLRAAVRTTVIYWKREGVAEDPSGLERSQQTGD